MSKSSFSTHHTHCTSASFLLFEAIAIFTQRPSKLIIITHLSTWLTRVFACLWLPFALKLLAVGALSRPWQHPFAARKFGTS